MMVWFSGGRAKPSSGSLHLQLCMLERQAGVAVHVGEAGWGWAGMAGMAMPPPGGLWWDSVIGLNQAKCFRQAND